MTEQPKSTRWLHLPRFSMRTGLLLFLAMGSGLGMTARWIQEVRRRGDIQLLLSASGTASRYRAMDGDLVYVTYAKEAECSWFVQTVRLWVHPEYDRRYEDVRVVAMAAGAGTSPPLDLQSVFGVESLTYSGSFAEEKLVASLAARGLRDVTIRGRPNPATDAKLLEKSAPPKTLERILVDASKPLSLEFAQWINRAPKLTQVNLEQITPEALPAFATAPNLQEVRLNAHQILRQALIFPWTKTISKPWQEHLKSFFDNLADREKLVRLELRAVILDDPIALRKFADQSKLMHLQLIECNIAPSCVEELSRLRSLKSLDLRSTPLKAKDLKSLAKMDSLQEITDLWCSDEEAVRELEAALPHCKITQHLK